MQRAGWDCDRVVLVKIESGQRTLLDYEVHFLLKVLKFTWADLVAENTAKPKGAGDKSVPQPHA